MFLCYGLQSKLQKIMKLVKIVPLNATQVWTSNLRLLEKIVFVNILDRKMFFQNLQASVLRVLYRKKLKE